MEPSQDSMRQPPPLWRRTIGRAVLILGTPLCVIAGMLLIAGSVLVLLGEKIERRPW